MAEARINRSGFQNLPYRIPCITRVPMRKGGKTYTETGLLAKAASSTAAMAANITRLVLFGRGLVSKNRADKTINTGTSALMRKDFPCQVRDRIKLPLKYVD